LTRFFNNERTKPAGNGRVSGGARISVQRGFSLVELMFSMFILLLVISVAFDQIMQLQKKAASESSRLDMSQEAREFIDQTVHDLHLAGYPNASMFAAAIPLTDPRVAAGIVNVSPTQLVFEGDINNDGQVYSVQLIYVPSDPADAN
jgi:prepilin-type N-terminal cleavage/methylation domain-containing protein